MDGCAHGYVLINEIISMSLIIFVYFILIILSDSNLSKYEHIYILKYVDIHVIFQHLICDVGSISLVYFIGCCQLLLFWFLHFKWFFYPNPMFSIL